MAKLNRNVPCPCNSGKKYKKCCLVLDEDPRSAELSLEDWAELNFLTDEKKKTWINPEPYMDLSPSVVFHGYTARKVGEKLYKRPLPEKEAFSNFLFALFIETVLGDEWMTSQERLPENRRHVVKKWLDSTNKWLVEGKENTAMIGSNISKKVNGIALSLLTLSYDIYCLLEVDRLPEKLMARLRNDAEFQGARYEVAIAGIFVRAGFSIEFCEELHGEKICEFIATHPSGLTIAVEAKSRHRTGVLNQKGNMPSEIGADIKRLYAAARKKKPKMPFAIFIDTNLPASPDIPLKNPNWIEEILKIHGNFPKATVKNPSPHNFVCFTHFCPYYAGEGEPYDFRPLNIHTPASMYPTTHYEIWERVWRKTDRYGQEIPRDI
ncbi:MAG: SEC-C metal-binding domain-containing protein [Candidatus Peribacteraceae bacterium]|nr:SEC-C metal-binding domain-containing protein [Candidatus Peribacteraceae bacterium]